MNSQTHAVPNAPRPLRLVVDRPRPSPEPSPWVMVVHGFKGFAGWGFFPELARRLTQRGFVSVRVEFSGNGVGEDGETMSEDQAFEDDTFSRQLEDLDCARRWVESGGIPEADPTRTSLLGHSRGGGVGLLHVASHPTTRSVVTWAAISHLERFDQNTRQRWRSEGSLAVPNARTGQIHRLGLGLLDDLEANRKSLDVITACRRIACPTLVIHGDADDTVPHHEAEQILGALPQAKSLRIDGGTHTFGATHPFTASNPHLDAVIQASLDHLVNTV